MVTAATGAEDVCGRTAPPFRTWVDALSRYAHCLAIGGHQLRHSSVGSKIASRRAGPFGCCPLRHVQGSSVATRERPFPKENER